MNRIALIVTIISLALIANSQNPCLPEGITFTTQEQIDSFQVNYPGCTEIAGNVYIHGDDITNLDELDVVTWIGGSLRIGYWDGGNPSLISLIGLENLTSIGGTLEISDNVSLTSLNGLESIISIGVDFIIHGNAALTNLIGLESLNSIGIGGYLYIIDNNALTSLEGFDNLTSIVGNININGNEALTNLIGLEGLNSIWGVLMIADNVSLTSLNGLESLTTLGGLRIGNNDALINLTGLENLTSFEHGLSISGNDALTSLTGLENLTSIGSSYLGWSVYIINNESLTNLTGLDNLSSIEGDMHIIESWNLTSLTGLENLSLVGGNVKIAWNYALTSLTGLGNIDPGSIGNIYLHDNEMLSECNVQSICDYLVAPNGSITIENNAPGCNSVEEVEEACLVGIEDNNESFTFKISPNPSRSRIITIYVNNYDPNLSLKCFNSFGQKVHQLKISSSKMLINTNTWQPGMYSLVLFKNGKVINLEKLVKIK